MARILIVTPLYGPCPDVFEFRGTIPPDSDSEMHVWECSNPDVYSSNVPELLCSYLINIYLDVMFTETRRKVLAHTHYMHIIGILRTEEESSGERRPTRNAGDTVIARVNASAYQALPGSPWEGILRRPEKVLPVVITVGSYTYFFDIDRRAFKKGLVIPYLHLTLRGRDAYPHEEGDEELIQNIEKRESIIIVRSNKNLS